MARIGLSKKTRFDVFKRDQFQCVYCGAHPSETVLLEVDHVIPVVEGGTNDIENLVTAMLAAEREAQIRAYYGILELRQERKDEEMWSVAEIFMDRFSLDSMRKDNIVSIRMFLERLNVFAVREAMEIACARKYSQVPAFKYFCGVCWSKIKSGET